MHVAMWPAILLAGVVAALSVLPLPPPATSASYRVALSQAVAQSTVNSSLALFATHAAQAAQAGADFIIFGEFTLFQPANRAQTLAICVKERATVLASTQAMVAQSKLHFAVVNFCDFDTATNKLWNANFVVGPTGVIAVYRKSHVWFTSIFDTPAQPDLVVVKQLGVSFGCFMCYDILFPCKHIVCALVSLALHANGAAQHPAPRCANKASHTFCTMPTFPSLAALLFVYGRCASTVRAFSFTGLLSRIASHLACSQRRFWQPTP